MYNLKFICKADKYFSVSLHVLPCTTDCTCSKFPKEKFKKIQSTCKCSIWTVWPPESPLVPLAPWLKMSLCSSSHLSSSQVHVHVRTPCHTRASRTHTAFREPIQTYQTLKYYIMFFPVKKLCFFTGLIQLVHCRIKYTILIYSLKINRNLVILKNVTCSYLKNICYAKIMNPWLVKIATLLQNSSHPPLLGSHFWVTGQ